MTILTIEVNFDPVAIPGCWLYADNAAIIALDTVACAKDQLPVLAEHAMRATTKIQEICLYCSPISPIIERAVVGYLVRGFDTKRVYDIETAHLEMLKDDWELFPVDEPTSMEDLMTGDLFASISQEEIHVTFLLRHQRMGSWVYSKDKKPREVFC